MSTCITKLPGNQPAGVLHSEFVAVIVPAVERHARIYFRHIKCPERKADLIAEAIGLAWGWFRSLARRGKDGTEFPSAFATFAARAVNSGRRVCGQERDKDVLSPIGQRRRGFAVASLPQFSTLNGNPLAEALTDNTQSPVPDQACFRIDLPNWLVTLDGRRRDMVIDMAMGHGTQELAAKYKVSESRISQIRREACSDWQHWHGEVA
jgi:hypothetical protein